MINSQAPPIRSQRVVPGHLCVVCTSWFTSVDGDKQGSKAIAPRGCMLTIAFYVFVKLPGGLCQYPITITKENGHEISRGSVFCDPLGWCCVSRSCIAKTISNNCLPVITPNVFPRSTWCLVTVDLWVVVFVRQLLGFLTGKEINKIALSFNFIHDETEVI